LGLEETDLERPSVGWPLFPQKQESRLFDEAFWISAFAGMTRNVAYAALLARRSLHDLIAAVHSTVNEITLNLVTLQRNDAVPAQVESIVVPDDVTNANAYIEESNFLCLAVPAQKTGK
jgi:hypothetical protein